MWPWSTIRKLREQVGYYKSIRDSVKAVKESYARDYGLCVAKAEVDRIALVEANSRAAEFQVALDAMQKKRDLAREERSAMRATLGNLRLQLAVARKNDARDPKGRFTKAGN